MSRKTSALVSFLGIASACSGGDGDVGPRDGDGGGDGDVSGSCSTFQDRDGDAIADQHDGTAVDSDHDGTNNFEDTDSDGDGLGDALEAGDGDICTTPRDTDGDTIPDFRDADSDGDALSDADEVTRYSTDPYDDDTDGDGFIDGAEVATRHNPNSSADGIPPEDFYVILPYGDPPIEETLRFGSNIRVADVFFLMDRTGSMSEEADTLISRLGWLREQMATRIPDIGIGVGHFEDFDRSASSPCGVSIPPFPSLYGAPGDLPFELLQEITTDMMAAQAGVNRLRDVDGGGAGWASSVEALYQTATGDGIDGYVDRRDCPILPDDFYGRVGYPCFRHGSLPIIVIFTDTASRNGPDGGGPNTADGYCDVDFPAEAPHAHEDTLAALLGIGARVFAVNSWTDSPEVGDPEAQFKWWATGTGTVDRDGAPIWFHIGGDGSGLDTSVVDAIEELSVGTPQDIDCVPEDRPDLPDPEVDATQFFVLPISPVEAYDAGGACTSCYSSKDDARFYGVTPGTHVEFRVTFRNTTLPGTAETRIFPAAIIVRGNGVATLDERDVVIIVPPSSDPFFG